MSKKVLRLLSNGGIKVRETRTLDAVHPHEDELLDSYSRANIKRQGSLEISQ